MDQFDLEQLNEVFDSHEDNNYDVVDLMPKAKTPQMFLLKGEGIENLVVRLMAQKGEDTLRNLTPSDKNVVVFIMTLNDKGNLGELKGGLGGNPVRALVSIFDTVYKAINTTIVQSIMFRFPAKKMAGQERSVRRILERLLVVRGKNRFVSLPEMANYSAKYSYVVAHKKTLDISDLPGASSVSDRFSKVDTKVGEAFIDTKTGKQVTKGEVVADAIFTSANKVDNKQVIAKSKISRREVMNAQYGGASVYTTGTPSAIQYNDLTNSLPDAIASNETRLQTVVSSANSRFKTEFEQVYENYASNARELRDHLDPDLAKLPTWQNQLMSRVYKGYEGTHEAKVLYGADLAQTVNSVLAKTSMSTIQTTVEEVVEILHNAGMQNSDLLEASRGFISEFEKKVNEVIRTGIAAYEVPNLDKSQEAAIRTYTGPRFKVINNYLLGKDKADSSTIDMIKTLDRTFEENGVRLEKGINLYRGQSLPGEELSSALERKVYYFKNFVSTSLAPIIFSGGFSNVSKEIVSPFVNAAVDEVKPIELDLSTTVSIGFVISGAHKLKTLVPGVISAYDQECEVILPRGTTLKFDRVKADHTGASVLIYASIIDPSKLDESEVVYDGDVLLETGKSVPVNKFSLIETSEEVRIAHETIRRDAVDEVLVSCMNINSIPEKFIL